MRRLYLILILAAVVMVVVAAFISSSRQLTTGERIGTVFLAVLGGLASLVAIINLLDRFNPSDKVIDIGPKFMAKDENIDRHPLVIVWGPKCSGKTWLMAAFEQCLASTNRTSPDGMLFSLIDLDIGAAVAHLEIPIVSPRVQDRTSIFRFSRTSSSHDYGQEISSFDHTILVYDNLDDTITEIDGEEIKHIETLLAFADANVVIIALDPTLLLTESGHGLTRSEYASLVSELFSVLEKANPKKERLYAICVMKADAIPDGFTVYPDSIVELYFGSEMTRVLDRLEPDRLQSFTTSAFGLIPGTADTNFDKSTHSLLDIENWRPYGVEQPFFWAIEETEKRILKTRLTRNLWGKIIAPMRLRKYIRYPNPQYDDDINRNTEFG